jgi:NADH-quinone oxidoreductase subunit J
MDQLSGVHLVYGLYLVLIISGGLVAVVARSLIRALCGLIITLFGVSGMYLLMAAPFIAFMQILIYVGAVTVLIFFAIMLTRTSDGESGSENPRIGSGFLGIWAAAFSTLVLAAVVIRHMPKAIPLKPETTMGRLGEFLTGPFALSFELISVALFVAMAGAVLLGFERRKAK